MRRWLLLAGAIVGELSASLCLKAAIAHPLLYLVVAVGYLLSFWLFGLVLRGGMPVGTAYAVWGAVGVALTAVLSAVLFGEALTPLTLAGMVLVIGGVMLVNLGGRRAGTTDASPDDARPEDTP